MKEIKGRIDAVMAEQHRCPTGVVGRLIGERMIRQHAPETRWAISLLHIKPADRILEIGCGAGRAIEMVAMLATEGQVTGIDLSPAMVRAATRRNARAIGEGRVAVRQGDVASLPFADRQFEKILSIHSAYFWPDPERAMAEIGRVLAPGGLLVLALSPGKVGEPIDAGFQAVAERRVMPSLKQAGFTRATIVHGPDSRQYRTVAIVGAKWREAR